VPNSIAFELVPLTALIAHLERNIFAELPLNVEQPLGHVRAPAPRRVDQQLRWTEADAAPACAFVRLPLELPRVGEVGVDALRAGADGPPAGQIASHLPHGLPCILRIEAPPPPSKCPTVGWAVSQPQSWREIVIVGTHQRAADKFTPRLDWN